MASHYGLYFDILLFTAPAVAWGLWELWSLRREEKETSDDDVHRDPPR